MINCISNCIYQLDGVCTLESAMSIGVPTKDACIHFVEKSKTPNSPSDIPGTNKPQPFR